jgi:hypothetical protein
MWVEVKEEVIFFAWCACHNLQVETFVISACTKEYTEKAYAGEIIYKSSGSQVALQALKTSRVTSKASLGVSK